MTWETFYDRFYDWADSTQVANISKLTDFGPSSEVCEIATSFVDEKAATRLVKKALAAGVRFTSAEVLELDGCVSEALFPELVKTVSTKFTADELDTISVSLSEADLKAAAKKSGLELDEDNFVVLEPNEMDAQVDQMLKDLDIIEERLASIPQPKAKKPGLGTMLLFALAAFGNSGKKNKKGKKHNGRCDGDCANCPPHYGYRYGRWYYGRHHVWGCQFGGNHGGGGLN